MHSEMPIRRTRRTRTPARRIKRRPQGVSRAVKKYVKKMQPKVEMKQTWFHENEIAINTLTQGLSRVVPEPIVAGTGNTNRIGNDINAMSYHLKGALTNNANTEVYVRCIFFGCNASVDPAAVFFRQAGTGPTAPVSSINGLDAIYFPINKLELKVMWDKVYKLAGNSGSTTTSKTVLLNKFIKLGGKKLTYKGPVDNIPDNYTYYVTWIASEAYDDTTTGQTVEVSYLSRFFYKDA
uniref:Capsid protein n=1 Tax=Syrmaticus reevesii CRESS-DNA-virus sp. TaxID=2815059 RepID=A0A8A4XCT9_9VIRU|nr:MAG: capsid protein [Syrmaticus reevesii CRESS-DNA-virus sp.]